MEPREHQQRMDRPIDEPVADGRRSAPAAPLPVADSPADEARLGKTVTQRVFDVFAHAIDPSASIRSRQPNWTRAQLMALWPILAHEEQYRQYEIRTMVGSLDFLFHTLNERLGRSAVEAINFLTQYVSMHLIELPWPRIARYRAVRNWLLAQAMQADAPILRQMGIEVFDETAEPCVTSREFVKALQKLWPQPPGCKDTCNHVVRHAELWRTIAATPTGWVVGLTLQRKLASEIADPFRVVGLARRHYRRHAWMIRLRFIKPGPLRETLQPAWQARVKQFGARRLTIEQREAVLACARSVLAKGHRTVPDLCLQVREILRIRLSVRTMWRYLPEVQKRLQHEQQQ